MNVHVCHFQMYIHLSLHRFESSKASLVFDAMLCYTNFGKVGCCDLSTWANLFSLAIHKGRAVVVLECPPEKKNAREKQKTRCPG